MTGLLVTGLLVTGLLVTGGLVTGAFVTGGLVGGGASPKHSCPLTWTEENACRSGVPVNVYPISQNPPTAVFQEGSVRVHVEVEHCAGCAFQNRTLNPAGTVTVKLRTADSDSFNLPLRPIKSKQYYY